MSYESIDFIKKISSLLSLITFVVLNNSIWVENSIYWTCEQSTRTGENIDSKIVKIGSNKCKLCYFQPTCISLGLSPLLPISKVYQMCL